MLGFVVITAHYRIRFESRFSKVQTKLLTISVTMSNLLYKKILFISSLAFLCDICASAVSRASTDVDSLACCAQAVYPEGKVWISKEIRGSASRGKISSVSYTLYDPYALVSKVQVFEVDPQGTLLFNKKVFEADATTIKCPPGYKTENPDHKELTKSPRSQTLCFNQNPNFKNLKADQFYAICRERTCTACHLDRLNDTQKYEKYVDIDSAKVTGDALKVELTILQPNMRYNVSLQLGVSQQSLTNQTIAADKKRATISVRNIDEKAYRQPIYLTVVPWPKDAPGRQSHCGVASRRQLNILPPLNRPLAVQN